MPGNSNLHDSSRNKQDEFYTNLQLIEDELKHYRAHFKGKRVLCNCDDPYESNFFKYFAMSFNSLGLKSLTATCYATSPVVYTQLDLFGDDGGAGRAALPKPSTARSPRGRARCPNAPKCKVPYKIVIWDYFESVMNWVKVTFPVLRGKLMKGLPWGLYFNKYGKTKRDGAALEKRIAQLLWDDEDVNDITNQRGIYEYLLS